MHHGLVVQSRAFHLLLSLNREERMTVFDSRENASHPYGSPKQGTRKYNGGETPQANLENTLFTRIPPDPRDRAFCSREGAFRPPPLAQFGVAAPLLSTESPTADVWRSSGGVAGPRRVNWRSGEPVLRGAYRN